MNETSRGLRTFFVIWLGQVVSTIGSSLTGFVLGVWVYRQTGSATQFALIAACSTLPAIVLAPLAGALVDRLDRRRIMIAAARALRRAARAEPPCPARRGPPARGG